MRSFSQIRRLFFLAFFVASCVGCQTKTVTSVQAENGKLDLSQFDFDKGPASIRGTWAFYWGRFIEADELITNGMPQPDGYLSTTGSWTNLENPQTPGEFYPAIGHATYILKLDLPEHPLTSRQAFGAAVFRGWYAGRIQIIERTTGQILADKFLQQPGKTASEEKYNWFGFREEFQPHRQIYALVHFSNHTDFYLGGLYHPLLLGSAEDLSRLLLKKNETMAVIFGLIFIIALYHLILFIFTPSDRASFWFSALSFDLALRLFVTERIFIAGDTPHHLLSEWMTRLNFTTWYAGIPMAVLLFWALFPKPKERWILKSFIGIGCIGTAISIFGPLGYDSQLQDFFNLTTLTLIAWIFSLIARNVRGPQAIAARIISIGFLAFAAGVIHDIHDAQAGGDADPLTQWGMVIMVLSQAIVLAFNRRQAEKTIAEKSKSLENELELRQRLEGELSQIEDRLRISHEQLERAEGLLLQAQRMSSLGELVASIGHEINNPVQQFGFALEIIETETKDIDSSLHEIIPGDEPEGRKVLEYYDKRMATIYTQLSTGKLVTNRLRELSQALCNGARADSHAIDNVDINKVLGEAVTIVGGKIKAYDLQWELGSLVPIRCRPSHVGQVFINLLSNAADAMSEMQQNAAEAEIGRIRIATEGKTRNGTEGVLINVEDSGPGIPLEIRDKVLEAFYTTKGTDKGTGLGLAISRKIVSNHDGDLVIDESPALGGARISVWLPQSTLN